MQYVLRFATALDQGRLDEATACLDEDFPSELREALGRTDVTDVITLILEPEWRFWVDFNPVDAEDEWLTWTERHGLIYSEGGYSIDLVDDPDARKLHFRAR